ncbi:hypothetical protein [Streptomyces sp. Inha503]|uniref:hypothetical protein n=1 Tax=Streptomyces sp. Inha503 TaxID=3383314 RepID=UPI00399FB746
MPTGRVRPGRRRALPAMAGAHLVLADARRLPLPDASVDLIVTSPPYSVVHAHIASRYASGESSQPICPGRSSPLPP